MKPRRFDYIRAETAAEAAQMLHELGADARILAGGQSLMPAMNMRLATPQVLLDISRSKELNYVRLQDGQLCVGAAATQSQLEWRPELAREAPLLAQAIPHISHFQIRNRGTVCGSIAHADPSAELPLVLLALEGSVILANHRSERSVRAADFFQGMLLTARRDDELVREVRFPCAEPGTRYAFEEFSLRRGDFAMVAVAVAVSANRIRLAVGGAADHPRAIDLAPDTDLEAAINDFAWSLDAVSDHHSSAGYKRHLVRHLSQTAIQRART